MTFEQQSDRYNSDPRFKAIVDMISYHMEDGNFTPGELHDATNFACVKFELTHTRPWIMPLDMSAIDRRVK